MARNCTDTDDNNKYPASAVSNSKSPSKPEMIKELLNNSYQDNKTKLDNDALSLLVEVAKYLVSETCLRASSHALRESSDNQTEHFEKCLPKLVELFCRALERWAVSRPRPRSSLPGAIATAKIRMLPLGDVGFSLNKYMSSKGRLRPIWLYFFQTT